MTWIRPLWRLLTSLVPERRYRLVRVAEFPQHLKRHRIYVEGEGASSCFATMLCPEGCGTAITLSLLAEDRPRWRLTEHRNGAVSLYPSVWRTRGCRCHFVLHRGRIQWCEEESRLAERR